MRLQELNISLTLRRPTPGLYGVWRANAFDHVRKLERWEDEVGDESALERHLGGSFLSLCNFSASRAWQVELAGWIVLE
ncbi:hypothetical protein [Microbispora sp. H10885]|uniref:hypothetical protein n=1 Tax=Microbispora sp. H10885 TaxID=2729110 RepID=UPI001600B592|nr:hypothetical protein [Microbispora sp. H10885]